MSPFWILPAVIVVVGMGVLSVYVRALGTAADDLRRHLDQFAEVRVAVDQEFYQIDAGSEVIRVGRTA